MFFGIKNIFKTKPKHSSELKQEGKVNFVLLLRDNEIGFLDFKDDSWFFKYSDWFINQEEILPIMEFPQKNIVYESKELWSFFQNRIPAGINRPSVKDDELYNDFELLKKFGKYTINNPFTLKSI